MKFILLPLAFATSLLAWPVNSQEWTRKDAGRAEYVQDRSDCAQEAQKMALVGDELQKDIVDCLAAKGWQRNKSDSVLDLHCEEKESIKACKHGGTTAIYNKDRAECFEHVMKTVGNTYSRPSWYGLGGLIVSSAQAEENKRNLERTQITSLKICFEGKGWSVELRGAAARKMEPERQSQPDTDRSRP